MQGIIKYRKDHPRMGMSGYISQRIQKILFLRSGNRCALPDCRRELVIVVNNNDPDTPLAEIAHIKGEKPGSARYDPSMTEDERNSAENLIIVCPTCHKKIDNQLTAYTVEELTRIKKEHEKWISDTTNLEAVNITFSELDVVTKYLVASEISSNGSLIVVPLREKMIRNKLTYASEKNILIGLLQVSQVGKFIEDCPDPLFGERLKQGFVSEYRKLKSEEGLVSDDLFDGLFEFASKGSKNFLYRAASLSVLVYLFEKCEVFER